MIRTILYIIFGVSIAQAQIQFDNQQNQLGLYNNYGFGLFGGGVSFFDFNNDGLDDITLATGYGSNYLFYRNNGSNFELENFNINTIVETKQVTWVDIDNDGDNDFYASSYADISRLYRNDGNNSFTEITGTCGLPLIIYNTFGGSWGDYNNDGFLDLFMSIRDLTGVDHNLLYKNNGNGTFTDVTVNAGLHTTAFYTFCAAFFDYNNDGWQDLYLANDKITLTKNILYRNNGDGTFTDVSLSSGTDLKMDAMSTTIGDYNNDGWLDIYITNTNTVIPDTTEGNALLRNNADGTFTNVAVTSGTQFNSIGWGAVFLDADNDTDQDLYVSGSRTGEFGWEPSAFYENNGSGQFTIPTNAGFQNDTLESYANAIGDIDNDGYPEIAVVNNNFQPIFLWKNQTPQNNNWLKVKLQGTVSNKMGIGSMIEISANGNKQYRYTLCGEGYLGQNSQYEFFGLAQETQIDYVKVTWLSGVEDYIQNVQANQAMTIVEGSHVLAQEDTELAYVDVYPNPATEFIKIRHLDNESLTIRLLDIKGATIFTKDEVTNETVIPVSHLTKGFYFVELESDIGKKVKKILIR